VIFGAILVGLTFGFLTYLCLKLSSDALVETAILLTGTYCSYLAAEHFHFSGILSVIVTVLISNIWIKKLINDDECAFQRFSENKILRFSATTVHNHKTILQIIDFLAMIASAAIFISIATLIDFNTLITYWKEIILIFVISTIIRGIMMWKFVIINNKFTDYTLINFRWWSILTFAGSKGALSILMVHMIPDTFKFKSLFEQIIIGNVLLSTVVYGLIIAGIISTFSKEFENDCKEH
jgi:CPA1 family monovalent cation:H+ antiporter